MNQRESELGPVYLEPSALIIKPLRVIFGEKLFWTLLKLQARTKYFR